MAKNPCAEDWAERLQLEHHFVSLGQPRLDPSTVREIVDRLEASFEAVATGQLEILLQGLDEVRARVDEAVASVLSAKVREPLCAEPDKPTDTQSISATVFPDESTAQGRLF